MNIDLENLEDVLSKSDLKLTCNFTSPENKNGRIDKAPEKIDFYWKRETETENAYGITGVTRGDLECMIKHLKSKDVKVPSEFYKALKDSRLT